jgi:hypothetical protein
MENSTSPLKKYNRQPKLYIDLPSKGQWYKKESLEKVEELEVYSMTANDEIATKTPDALLTGNAIVKVIQNCVPSIKDGWAVTSRDLDYLLASIRIATYGDTMSVSHNCSKCANEDNFSLPLQKLLDHLQSIQPVYEIKVNDFVIRLRPLIYKEIVANQLASMQVRRQLYQISDSKIEDSVEVIENKTNMINSLYDKISDQTKDIICSVVTEVITPDGESETNPIFIKDFILNSEGQYFNAIQDIYLDNNKIMSPPSSDVSCSACEHTDKVTPSMDYSSFFLRR